MTGHGGGSGGRRHSGDRPGVPPSVRGQLGRMLPGMPAPAPRGGAGGPPGGPPRGPGGNRSGQTPGPGSFDSLPELGYTRVDRSQLPQNWMRDQSGDFRGRIPGNPARSTTGGYRLDGDIDTTPVASSPKDRSVYQDLDYTRVADAQGRPMRGPALGADHAEMRVAQELRRQHAAQAGESGPGPGQPRHADVVLDNSTCGSRSFDRDVTVACDRVLPGAMPAGDTMTVYGSTDGGKTFWTKTFTGTGSLIR